MRRPLLYQILLPMMAAMLCTLLVVTAVNVRLAADNARANIEQQLQDVRTTLKTSTFRLTDAVLSQMQGLSGAHYVLLDEEGSTQAASDRELAAAVAEWPASEETGRLSSSEPIVIGGEPYLHVPMVFTRDFRPEESVVIHALYPESRYRAAWQKAVAPPLLIGVAAMGLVLVISIVVASRVTSPIRKLRWQVEHIAAGELSTMPLPARNDEIRDLVKSVNRMAVALAEYEEQLVRAEQLKTLGQIGGAIAHQLRNSVTGCRMALDLHRRECAAAEDDESLAIATRELSLMEATIRRLLSGAGTITDHKESVDVAEIAAKVVGLVETVARHKGVELTWERPAEPARVRGNAEQIEQVIVNLMLNAVDAAAMQVAPGGERRVSLEVRRQGGSLELVVSDTGPGPSEAVQEKLFEPLVTDKAGGTGLGLSIVKEIVVEHGGQVQWEREHGVTRFRASLPLTGGVAEEKHGVEAAGRR